MKSPLRLLALILFVTLLPTAAAQEGDWFLNPANGHWYTLDHTTRTVHEARDLATSLNGHLVTINDQAEQDWIEATFAPYGIGAMWIGLNDELSDGTYVWDSGEVSAFTNWGSSQPDNGQGPSTQFVRLSGPSGALAQWTWDDFSETGLPGTRALIECAVNPASGWSWPRETATGSSPHYTTLGDMDGDGDLDVIVPANGSNQVEIYWNDGAGVLDPAPTVLSTPSPYVPMPIDRDQDGDLDLLVTAYNDSVGCREWINDGAGGFSVGGTPEGVRSHGIDIGDIDLDGIEDAVWSMHNNHDWRALRPVSSIPGGGFSLFPWFGTDNHTHFVRIVDLNADGAPDLVSSSTLNDRIRTWIGNGAGGFSSGPLYTTDDNPWQIELADLDNDGDQDIIVAVGGGSYSYIRLYENNGSLAGIDLIHQGDLPMGAYPRDVKVHDFNGDGFFDMAAACYNSNDLRIRYGVGPFDFSGPEVIFQNHTQALDLATGDLNGDGLIDLVTTSNGANKITIHLNHFSPIVDCDGNGVHDPFDLTAGAVLDCNGNGLIDSCELALDPSLDLDLNGILDSCEVSGPYWFRSPLTQRLLSVLPPTTWGSARIQATALSGALVTVRNAAENDWLQGILPGDQFWIGYHDATVEGTFMWHSLETPGYENWAPGAPGNFTADQDFVAFKPSDGTWETFPGSGPGSVYRAVVESNGIDCDGNLVPDEVQIQNNPSLDMNGDGLLDSCVSPSYCTGAINSSGEGGSIHALGSPELSQNNLTLRAVDLPTVQWSYFLMSQNQANVPGFGGSQGVLCVGAPIVRFNMSGTGQVGQTTAGGTRTLLIDFSNLPQAIVFQPGDTWNFQLWFRDVNPPPTVTSNTTNGVTVMFR